MNLDDLRVCRITPTWDKAFDPPEFFGNVISYDPVTISDLKEVLSNLTPEQLEEMKAFRFERSGLDLGPFDNGDYLVMKL